MPNGPSPGPHT